ncbi:MAG TPA: ectoine/hydroxyectoine ABC transporter permease subunit EhuC [Acidimicrobiales bacterium]|nr:ectoine/hydroxyectoine ABC transporter permease subunit EhuC [Acidimicrobiales bacterium]
MLSSGQLQQLLTGAWTTIQVTAYSAVIGTLLALVGGVSSLSGSRLLRWFTRVYVELFRGVSAIILLFWVYFTLPQLFGIFLTPLQAGMLALGTNMGAYGSEIARGAIQAIPKGQTEAAIAINLSPFRRLRHVVLPQAIVLMLPPFGNLLIEVMKASALVSLIDLSDLTERAQNLRTLRAAASLEIFTAVLVMYFLISLSITLGVRMLERRFGRGLDVGSGLGGAVK